VEDAGAHLSGGRGEQDQSEAQELQRRHQSADHLHPVVETKYPWGTGFTQRVVHHYMGAGIGPDTIEYHAEYVGMIGGSIFELSANGVPSATEAYQWAKIVAEKAGTLNPANIGN
jgi:hypothetical protein